MGSEDRGLAEAYKRSLTFSEQRYRDFAVRNARDSADALSGPARVARRLRLRSAECYPSEGSRSTHVPLAFFAAFYRVDITAARDSGTTSSRRGWSLANAALSTGASPARAAHASPRARSTSRPGHLVFWGVYTRPIRSNGGRRLVPDLGRRAPHHAPSLSLLVGAIDGRVLSATSHSLAVRSILFEGSASPGSARRRAICWRWAGDTKTRSSP